MPLVNLWGFGPELKPSEPPADELIREALQNIGVEKITLNEATLYSQQKRSLDFSAIAKSLPNEMPHTPKPSIVLAFALSPYAQTFTFNPFERVANLFTNPSG